MEDLIAFLNARLDEDEAAANEAAGDTGPEWNCHPEGLRGGIVIADGGIVVYDEGRPAEAEAEHIARHAPARVLREVAAKRAILSECDLLLKAGIAYPDEAGPEVARIILRHLAAVYGDHPGYQPEWKS